MKNKKSDKKIYIIFIVVMAVLYGAGYQAGRWIKRAEKSGSLETALGALKDSLTTVVPPLYFVLAAASLIVICLLYLSCKKMYKTLQDNPEDDDLWDSLEEKLNQPLILSNVMTIMNVFFFGCVIWIAEFNSYGKSGGYETVILIADFVLFFVMLAVTILVSKGIVDMEKKLNPEKQGNVFDFKFNEVWFSSCDEAQKLITYKAAYKAFMDTNYTCIVLYILTFMGMFIFKTGIYPLFCVCVVMLVNNLSYMLRAAKLERR
ncbi:MAG: DUF3169 family protein [Bacteroidales bacterium]|nr:DUF3169 family protein [Clostridium sp.]MCM1204604.1 DUF3169 family protein [Bacteroidales bacterium]